MPATPPRNVGAAYFFSELQAFIKRFELLSLPDQERVAEIFAYKCDEIIQQIDLTAEIAAIPSDTTFNISRKV